MIARPRTLNLAPELRLPLDTVTQTIAILAKKRRGKTYTASVLAEEFVAAGLPFVAIDPTGAWWGLRASADGEGPGLPVVVVGGDHGDLPLDPTQGAAVADLVVDHPGWYVLDLSLCSSNAEQDRFATDFAERLYRRKATSSARAPMHLFVDEADAFVPQQAQPGQMRMLGAFDTIVRRGGIRGIGVTLISQRPAVVSKNVLSQCELLIALQIVGEADRDAIDGWVKGNGTKEQRVALQNSLASLDLGEAWAWSPSWLNVFTRIRVRQRKTFNSSKTPETGDRHEPKELARVDIEKIRTRLGEVLAKAKADDPKELRARVAQLERELANVIRTQPAPAKAVEVPAVSLEVRKELDGAVTEIGQVADELQTAAKGILQALGHVAAGLARATGGRATPPAPPKPQIRFTNPKNAPEGNRGDAKLGAGERAVLTAVAQHGHAGVTREQLTVLVGYKRSTRDLYLQRLRAAGLVDGAGDALTATDAGLSALGPDFEPLPTGDALRAHWLQRLPEGERRCLELAVAAHPKAVDRDELGEKAGYKRSTRDLYLQRLAARKLVIVERGAVRASAELFDA